MGYKRTRVSIGLPVYNGEQFLAAALDSLLAQSFDDFELIISDNGSSDGTEGICQDYVTMDKRIRYFRGVANLGAAWNYNRVFALSSGEYFKWAAYDDLCAPDFLIKCVTVLDRELSVVLCYTRFVDIDEQGKRLRARNSVVRAESVKPIERFRSLIQLNYTCEEIFGLIRASILRRTPLIGNYADSDRVLLSELSLYGRFHKVPESLFLHRLHPGSSVHMFPGRYERTAWFNPAVGLIVLPYWREFFEYLLTIRRSPLAWLERVFCCLEMCRWVKENRQRLLMDVLVCAKRLVRRWIKGLGHEM